MEMYRHRSIVPYSCWVGKGLSSPEITERRRIEVTPECQSQ
jgi:hypothetical protein